ncbi:transposase [Streptomyces sp. TRM68367]|nr:transposase [Streptomyces sp. TRM68367]
MEDEITDHLGYHKHEPAEKNCCSSRNGMRAKTVLADVGPGEGRVPRGRRRQVRAAQIVE